MKLSTGLLIGFGLTCVVLVAATPDPVGLAKRLADPSSKRRSDAAGELLAMGANAAPALETAASSPDPEVRTRARALLALVREDDAVRAAARAREADAAVREALRTPGGLERDSPLYAGLAALSPETGRALAAAARRVAEHDFVSRALACALARHATTESLTVLAECVASERLFPSAGLCAARELDREFAADAELAAAIRDDASSARASLVLALQARSAPTRRMAVALYGTLAGDACAVALIEMSDDPDFAVRAETCRALGDYAASESAAALRRLAHDPSQQVRGAALLALAHVPGTPRPEPAVASAEDASPAIRAAAAHLLGRDATPDSLGVLDALACDASPRVRAAARRALIALRE